MRRLGKILVCVVASLAAAFTSYHGMRLGLTIWAELGRTTYTEADVPQLAAMFVEATTLPNGGGQVFLELHRDTRLRTASINITPSEADLINALMHTYGVWTALATSGDVARAKSPRRETVADVGVSFADRPGTRLREEFPADSTVHQVGWTKCSIQLALSQDRTKILQADTIVTAGTLPPFWRTTLEPCVARGLFASVGLVGNTCVMRPSVLCSRDDPGQGKTVDYFLLRVLSHVRQQEPVSLEAIQNAIRTTLAKQSRHDSFSNPRGLRLSDELFLVNRWINAKFYTDEEVTNRVIEVRQTWWERWLLL